MIVNILLCIEEGVIGVCSDKQNAISHFSSYRNIHASLVRTLVSVELLSATQNGSYERLVGPYKATIHRFRYQLYRYKKKN